MKRKTIYKIIHKKQKQKQKTKQNTKKKKRVYLSLMIISMFFVSKRCTYRWFRTRRMRYEEQQQVTSSGNLVPFLVYFLLSGRWGVILLSSLSHCYFEVLRLCMYFCYVYIWIISVFERIILIQRRSYLTCTVQVWRSNSSCLTAAYVNIYCICLV